MRSSPSSTPSTTALNCLPTPTAELRQGKQQNELEDACVRSSLIADVTVKTAVATRPPLCWAPLFSAWTFTCAEREPRGAIFVVSVGTGKVRSSGPVHLLDQRMFDCLRVAVAHKIDGMQRWAAVRGWVPGRAQARPARRSRRAEADFAGNPMWSPRGGVPCECRRCHED